MARVIVLVQQLRYGLYLIFHPFDGFWDIKHEKRGSLATGVTLLAVFTFLQVLSYRVTGVLFNDREVVRLNLLKDIAVILLVFFLWCVANWCLTTLMDGEGSFGDIVTMTAYSLLPMILMSVPLIALSHILSFRESSFYMLFLALGQLWSGFLLIIGTMTTHQYSLSRTLFTILLTIIGMCIIVFIGLLFFNLIQQMAGFLLNVYQEISLRTG